MNTIIAAVLSFTFLFSAGNTNVYHINYANKRVHHKYTQIACEYDLSDVKNTFVYFDTNTNTNAGIYKV